MRNKVLTIVLVCVVSMSLTISVCATPNDDLQVKNKDLQRQQEEINNNNSELDNVQKESAEIQRNIENLDFQIEQMIIRMNDNDKQIQKTQEDITFSENEIKKAEDELAAQKELLNKRLKAMYINGSDGYIEILFGSQNISDFLVRIETLKKIVGLDKKIIGSITEKKDQIFQRKATLEEDKNKLVLLQDDNKQQMDKLNASKDQQEKLMAQAKEKSDLLKSRIQESKNKIDETNKIIQKIKDAISEAAEAQKPATPVNNSPSKPDPKKKSPPSSNAIVAYASNFIGCPYIWGANGEVLTKSYMEQIISTYGSRYPRQYLQQFIGLQVFDCSGFVTYVFDHFGIEFSGSRPTTYSMVNEGKLIPKNQMQPGDVVYFGTSSDVHHVGIYVGNGCFIEAPKSMDEVKISVLSDRSDFYCARRM